MNENLLQINKVPDGTIFIITTDRFQIPAEASETTEYLLLVTVILAFHPFNTA